MNGEQAERRIRDLENEVGMLRGHLQVTLTARDQFAAVILGGVLADPNVDATTPEQWARLATECYEMADAMLAERAKGLSK